MIKPMRYAYGMMANFFIELNIYFFKADNIMLLICNQNFLSFKFTLSGFTIGWKAIPSDNARKAFAFS
jgi:hypothetical protein